ncbi:MAG: glycosyltransferase family 39 protein [Endomicrobiales bacterium]|jgi:4-amino-4-deoxy-L-arabinose transferase-like glycosyltransferase
MNIKVLYALALIVSGIVIFHRLGEAPLGGDDCYYSQVSKEMARSGDYLTPRNGGMVDFHTSKPPVLYWMNIATGKLFGFTNAAMRLPAAVLGFVGVICCALFVSRYFSPTAGIFSVIILTFTQQYLYHARSAVTDGPFAVFFSLAMIAFWIARAERSAGFYYLFGLCAGLAVMTRQIPGFFIFTAIIVFLLLSKDTMVIRSLHFWGAFLVAGAVILPWHIIMFHRFGYHFLKQYFGVTLMTGISGYPAGYSSSPSLNPWHAYFDILLSNYWPWLPFFVYGVYRFFRQKRNPLMLFILCWAFVPFAIFQLAKVKQFHYIVPLYVPFAIITASVFDAFSPVAKQRTLKILTGLIVVVAIVYCSYPVIPLTLDSQEFRDTITLVPAARSVAGDINVGEVGFSHYNNCLMFYADKKVIKNSEEQLIDKIRSDVPAVFAVPKELFDKLIRMVNPARIIVLKTSQKSVLFETTLYRDGKYLVK